MDYQIGVTPCPQCGSSDQVRTASQLLDMINGARQQGFQQPGGPGQQGGFQQPGSPQPGGFQQPGGSQQPGGFGQPQPFGQPGGFGQPQPFGQPGGFGQPQPFGQSDQSQQPDQSQAGQSQQPGQAQQTGQAAQPGQFPQQEPFQQPAQPGNWNNGNDDDYDHYNGEGNRFGFPFGGSRRDGFDAVREGLSGDIGGAVMGAALGFAGRALAKKMKKAYDEKIAPAMAAQAAQAQQQSQQQWQQSQADQQAIVARYPELRCCLADQVIFLDAGYKTVPMRELTMPVTLAQADAVVTRLR